VTERVLAVAPAWFAVIPTLAAGWVPLWYVAVFVVGFATTGALSAEYGARHHAR
jgi:hypothetical protein